MKKLLAALLVATSAIPASATVFHYTLSNATFTDGGVMTGGFDYNTDQTHTVGNFSFVTTSSGVFVGRSYTNSNTYLPSVSPFYIYGYNDSNYSGAFQLVLTSFDHGGDDFNSGHSLDLDTSFITIVGPGNERFLNSGAQFVVGDAADVPEPAMLGLFGLGAIGLGLSRRRKS